MVDAMNPSSDPRDTWRLGQLVLLVTPFIGAGLTFTDPPRWLQIVGVIAIVALVWIGGTMMSRREGGWRPSETHPRDHER
jgi:hypothetical protein